MKILLYSVLHMEMDGFMSIGETDPEPELDPARIGKIRLLTLPPN